MEKQDNFIYLGLFILRKNNSEDLQTGRKQPQ